MKIAAYLIGSLLILGGIIYGAMALGVPQLWLTVIGLVGGGLVITSVAGKVVKTSTTQTSNGGTTTESETVVQ